MKKIKNFFKKNVRLFVGILIGGVLVGGSVYAATIIGAGEVSYTPPSGSGISSTNVQDAIDELYTKAASGGLPSFAKTNSAKTIIASPAGILFKRSNGNTYFISSNNWAVEKDHIQQVFSDISCTVKSSRVDCPASDFSCFVRSDGYFLCYDNSGHSSCSVYSDGTVGCS